MFEVFRNREVERQYFSNKWHNINEEIAYKSLVMCPNATYLRS